MDNLNEVLKMNLIKELLSYMLYLISGLLVGFIVFAPLTIYLGV